MREGEREIRRERGGEGGEGERETRDETRDIYIYRARETYSEGGVVQVKAC